MRASIVTVRNIFNPAESRQVTLQRRRRRIRTLAPVDVTVPVMCCCNGEWLLRSEWKRRVRHGDVILFVAVPQGGGGGSNPLAIILTIALAYVTFGQSLIVQGIGLGVGTLAAYAANAAIYLVGSALINAVFPAKTQTPASSAALPSASPTYNLQASGNLARIGSAIPDAYGRNRITPDFAAQPYGEYAGNDQVLYELFVIGQGAYAIEGIFVDDTPIENFQGVTFEIVQPGDPVTLFPANVVTASEVSGLELASATADSIPPPADPVTAGTSGGDSGADGYKVGLVVGDFSGGGSE